MVFLKTGLLQKQIETFFSLEEKVPGENIFKARFYLSAELFDNLNMFFVFDYHTVESFNSFLNQMVVF